jgi:uncharacterized membrane protein
MRQFLLSFICTAGIMFPLDFIWLYTASGIYKAQMGGIMLEQPRILPAIAFYLIYAAGVAFFAIMPNLNGGTFWTAAGYGAALGLVAYGTYDATNHATLKDFSANIMIMDWTWGTFLTAITAGCGWKLMSWWQG